MTERQTGQAEQPVGSAPNVPWRASLEEARREAERDGKLVFIYLWHHKCGGSKTMGEKTYQDDEALSYLEQHFVPVRFNTIEESETEASFDSGWTPTLIIEDASGTEHRRSQGYLDLQRFIGVLALARVVKALDEHEYEEAVSLADEALEATKRDPQREPEAMYWKAVSIFEVSGDRGNLTGNWETLLDRFPESEWSKKASYIRM